MWFDQSAKEMIGHVFADSLTDFSLKVCAHLDLERRRSEELRSALEKEREELRTKLRDATNEVREITTFVECVFLSGNSKYS